MSKEQNKKIRSKTYVILSEYVDGSLSPELEEKIQGWLMTDRDRENKDKALYDIYDECVKFEAVSAEFSTAPVQRPVSQMHTDGHVQQKKRRPSIVSRGMWLRYAAILLLAVVIPAAVYYLSGFMFDTPMITLTASDGETKQITLPDGSEVFLKSSSTLSYADDFLDDRKVALSGEALFSVRKSAGKPFIVNARDLEVEVLGTEFNVHNYPEDTLIGIKLIEGAVSVGVDKQDITTLKPQTQLIYNTITNTFNVLPLHAFDILKIKGKLLHFNDLSLREVLERLAYQFDNKIIHIAEGCDFSKNVINVEFNENEDLGEVLYVLRTIAPVFNYKQVDDSWLLTSMMY